MANHANYIDLHDKIEQRTEVKATQIYLTCLASCLWIFLTWMYQVFFRFKAFPGRLFLTNSECALHINLLQGTVVLLAIRLRQMIV